MTGIEERFWQKVDRRGPDECWPWLASRQVVSGRGQFSVDGRPRPAHYVAFELAYGPIPEGHDVRQTCGDIVCVNPAHLVAEAPLTISERFWAKVKRGAPDECWEWQAGTNHDGYAWFRYDAKHPILGHRFAWEEANGPIPPGEIVLHRCDNRPCVNPGHLFLGSIQDNMDDRNTKGRQARGERHASAILTESAVIEIRKSGDVAAMAAKYGVAKNTIISVIRRDTWRHLP